MNEDKLVLPKYTQFKYFEIYQPRWHDRKVLLACHKVGQHNKIVFTQAPSLGTEPYYVSGTVAKKCKKVSNGTINCYAVDLDKLRPLEIEEKSHLDY